MTRLDERRSISVHQRSSTRLIRRGRTALLTVLGFAALLITFHNAVLRQIGEFLVVSDPLEHADLIYVLAGDFWGSRVLLGAQLGAEHWAPRVMLGGGRYQSFYTPDLSVGFAVDHGYPRNLFIPVRMDAVSTIEEARTMAPSFRSLGAKRIILVTSNFHSRRAAEVFRLFLPGIDFRMEAAPDPVFHPDRWWKNPEERRLLLAEYEKLLGTYIVRLHLASSASLRRMAHRRGDR